MSTPSACPVCTLENTYQDGALFICPDCGHEWAADGSASEADEEAAPVLKDANGQILADGDSAILIKDLKVRGTVLKQGAKIKSIRLVPGDHPVDCKIDGQGYLLKAEFIKKT